MPPPLKHSTPSAFLYSRGRGACTYLSSEPEGQPEQGKKKHLAFTGWQQQQQQRHSHASLQQAGPTRLNPAGSGMCSETH